MTKSLWSGDERYLKEYWSTWEDLWDHGDFAQKDADGFWFLHGRADDALNVAGRKVGPAGSKASLIDHDAVNQAARSRRPRRHHHRTAVVAYVVLEPHIEPSDDLREELRTLVGEEHGKPFRPRELLFVDAFPKTQSGRSSDARSRRFIRARTPEISRRWRTRRRSTGSATRTDGQRPPDRAAGGKRIFYGESRRKPRASARG